MSYVERVIPNRVVLLVIILGILAIGHWLADWSSDYAFGAIMGMLALFLVNQYKDSVPND